MLIYLKQLQRNIYQRNSENIHASKVSHVYPVLHYSALPPSPEFTHYTLREIYSLLFFKQDEIAVVMLLDLFFFPPPHHVLFIFAE